MAPRGKCRAETFAMFTLCHCATRATTDGRHWHLPCIAWTLLWKFVWWISWSRPTRTCPQDWHRKSCKIFERNKDKYRIYLENLESPTPAKLLIFGWKKCGLLRIEHWFISTRIGAPAHHAFLRVQHFLLLSTTFTKSCQRYLRLVGGQTVCGDLGGHFVGFLFRPCEQRRWLFHRRKCPAASHYTELPAELSAAGVWILESHCLPSWKLTCCSLLECSNYIVLICLYRYLSDMCWYCGNVVTWKFARFVATIWLWLSWTCLYSTPDYSIVDVWDWIAGDCMSSMCIVQVQHIWFIWTFGMWDDLSVKSHVRRQRMVLSSIKTGAHKNRTANTCLTCKPSMFGGREVIPLNSGTLQTMEHKQFMSR